MKNLPLENRFIYCLAGTGPSFGTGHLRRMNVLNGMLNSSGLKSKSVIQENEIDINPAVIIFDRRDEPLTPGILKIQESSVAVVAIDNRGKGRDQAGWIYDTLPHPDMNHDELNIAIGRILLSPFFTERASMAREARLYYIQEDDIQDGEKTLLHMPGIEIDQFQEKLLRSDKVFTYFGQTLFEAIYCGKEVYLYGMNTYHRYLAEWFSNFWNQNQPGLYFDGKGYEKLIQYIELLVKRP